MHVLTTRERPKEESQKHNSKWKYNLNDKLKKPTNVCNEGQEQAVNANKLAGACSEGQGEVNIRKQASACNEDNEDTELRIEN